MTPPPPPDILVQLLDEGNFNAGKLFKLERDSLLRLQLANRIVHERVRLFANLPPAPAHVFERATYYEYELRTARAHSLPHDDFDRYFELACSRSGSFHYYFVYGEAVTEPRGGSNFLVEPRLCLADGTRLPLNSLQMQTVLTKCLGPLDEWRARLRVAKETGYNMLHFTPVQQISDLSRSSYCLRDHLQLIQDAGAQHTMADLERLVDSMYREWNMLSICDLVYNHMANEADFVRQHPDATFNMHNAPHLRPAFVLDRILYYASADIAAGKYEAQGVSAQRLHEYNMDTLRHILRHQEVAKYKLDEFFALDVNKVLATCKAIGLEELANIEALLNETTKARETVRFVYLLLNTNIISFFKNKKNSKFHLKGTSFSVSRAAMFVIRSLKILSHMLSNFFIKHLII